MGPNLGSAQQWSRQVSIPQTFNHLVLPLAGGTLAGLALMGLPALHCPRWNLGLCLEHPWRVEYYALALLRQPIITVALTF